MDFEWSQQFAERWCVDWNAHDIDPIVAPYADNVRWVSAAADRLCGSPYVEGKAAVRECFAQGLNDNPGVHFEVASVRVGTDSIVIDYCTDQGQTASEVMIFRDGLVVSGFAAYGPTPS